jgi:hypothetical protein
MAGRRPATRSKQLTRKDSEATIRWIRVGSSGGQPIGPKLAELANTTAPDMPPNTNR